VPERKPGISGSRPWLVAGFAMSICLKLTKSVV
jgi:hypothetical protein